jgi:hypothetical protein
MGDYGQIKRLGAEWGFFKYRLKRFYLYTFWNGIEFIDTVGNLNPAISW